MVVWVGGDGGDDVAVDDVDQNPTTLIPW